MTSVVFVHGTGVREPQFTATFERVRHELAGLVEGVIERL